MSASYAWKESALNESLLNVQNKNIQGSIRQNLNNTISFIVYDANKSQVVGSSGDNAAEIFARKVSLNANNKELYPAVASVVSDEGFNIYVFVSRDTFETNVKNRIKDFIRAVRLGDDGYIWINEIINYDGGDDYAIRLVHPNLPHTEGLKLSTNTQDINSPLIYS